MGDLISRSALINVLNRNSIFQKITNVEGKNTIEIINEQPTIEAVPVVHGEWEKNAENDIIVYCNQCYMPQDIPTPYCHHCGADMRKGGAE